MLWGLEPYDRRDLENAHWRTTAGRLLLADGIGCAESQEQHDATWIKIWARGLPVACLNTNDVNWHRFSA